MSIMNNHDFLSDIYSIRPKFTYYVRKFPKKISTGVKFQKKKEKNDFFENL